ncbi:Ureohydrolase [Suillus clintonianus]|uniref:Ureohydrolase n=1 Tax=Suillus clintonianus TaxID=1904413 RepID=UPI001B8643E0|nr:Ureohydrolase [Suillus clintonianus]KAG2157528.1 Ureohydrolase [Suillus clintonianus]
MSSAPSNKFLPSPKTVAILGCPFSGGQPKLGVDKGPIHLVQAGLIQQVEELGWRVVFDGHHQFEDISPPTNGTPVNAANDAAVDPLNASIAKMKSPLFVAQVCESVASAVQAHAEMGQLPVTLGGDHSLAMGTISGTLRAYDQACVIWIDAHADINTIHSTDSGNIHGMPLSFLLKLNPPAPSPDSVLAKFDWVSHLPAERLVYIGLRDVDKGEKEILKQHNIKAFSMHEVDRYGIGKVVEMALDYVNPQRDRPIHLSFDVDALDPSVAPSTGTPVRGGLTFREGHYICEAIHETGLLVALDIMEVNPALADAESVRQTVAVGCSLVRSALGKSSICYVRYLHGLSIILESRNMVERARGAAFSVSAWTTYNATYR